MAIWKLLPCINSLCTRRLVLQDSVVFRFKSTFEEFTLPPRPKRPLTPYAQYVQTMYSKLQQENSLTKPQDIMRQLSKEWALVDQDVKSKMYTQYSEHYATYKEELKAYNNSLTDEQRRLTDKSLKKNKVELPGKPKKPISAFFLYVNSMKSTKDPKDQYASWLVHTSEKWHTLEPETKEKYYTEWKQLNETYMIELKKWKENVAQTNFPSIEAQNKENIKIGWGTDITTSNTARDQQYKSARSLVLYKARNNLQAIMQYPRDIEKDPLNDVKPMQLRIKINKYFASAWKRIVTMLNKTYGNWKTVREYVFIGVSAILIATYCVLNLMYK